MKVVGREIAIRCKNGVCDRRPVSAYTIVRSARRHTIDRLATPGRLEQSAVYGRFHRTSVGFISPQEYAR
jgi:hypothetical protein